MEQKQDNKFIINFKFTCKCGNHDMDKFIKKRLSFSLELLCILCERKYKIQLTSQEKKLWQKH